MDNSFINADIFFFITTVAVIIITALLVAGMLYIISILRTIRTITKTAKTGADIVVEGLHEAKDSFKNGVKLSTLGNIFKKAYTKRKNK